jgi:hypothetical protein
MWAEVIFRTYYNFLHNSRIRTDVITIVRRKSVLRQNTCKTLLIGGALIKSSNIFY